MSNVKEKQFCKCGKCEIRAHHSELDVPATPFSRTLFDAGQSFHTMSLPGKKAELQLAAHVACYSRILTAVHLGCVMEEISKKQIGVQRTQCIVTD